MTKEEILKTRIILVPDDDVWFAQGIDVDYFASGETPEETIKNFQDGLKLMIQDYENRNALHTVLSTPFKEVFKLLKD